MQGPRDPARKVAIEDLLALLDLDRPLVWLDYETTGKRSATARVVQIAFVKMRPDGTVRRFKSLINPGRPIPASTTEIHGITDEMVKDAPTWESLAPRIAATMDGSDYGGYNVRYDLDVTVEEQKRAGIKFSWEQARILDGFRLWQIVEPRSLSDFIKAMLNESADEAHDAGFDIEGTARGVASLLRAAGLPRTMAELDALQFPRDPDSVDRRGKIYWEGTEAAFSFGKHKGKLLRDCPKGYLSWVAYTAEDFSDEVRRICAEALDGRFPVYKEEEECVEPSVSPSPSDGSSSEPSPSGQAPSGPSSPCSAGSPAPCAPSE